MQKIITGIAEAINSTICAIGFHDYEYFIETHKCTGVKHVESMDMKIRECRRCGKRQHGMLPTGVHLNQEWKNFHYEPEEVLHFMTL